MTKINVRTRSAKQTIDLEKELLNGSVFDFSHMKQLFFFRALIITSTVER